MGPPEVAERIGVSRQRVYVLMKTYDDFPEPASTLRSGPVWHTTDVEAWLRKHPTRPSGRRPRSS